MMTTRKTRIFIALCAIASLLFTQLAVASYACPGAPSPEAVAAVQDQSGCEEMDRTEPGLCHAHCLEQAQSIDKPVGVSIPAAPPSGLEAAPAPVASASFVAVKDLPSLLVRSTAPPFAIRNCCLRI